MRIALAQMDPIVGDFPGNTGKMLDYISRAKEKGCDLVVFPELSLYGYPPRDLLDKPSFAKTAQTYWDAIRNASSGIGVVFGAVTENISGSGKPYYNSVVFFADEKLLAVSHKRLLPSYDVFDEERYFEPGEKSEWVEFRGERIGLTVCEDIWNVEEYLPRRLYRCDPVCELRNASAGILVNISASPYHVGKIPRVGDLLKSHASGNGMHVVYVNQVGGNDELIFHGHSMAWDDTGILRACGADFKEDFVVYDTTTRSGEIRAGSAGRPGEVLDALVLGLRDYAFKCGFKQAVVGLSGGIDSALTACIASLALGPDNVMGVAMPGPYNAPESLEDARLLAVDLGIAFRVVSIASMFEASLKTLEPAFEGLAPDVTEENLQARLRGVILMAFSNKFNRLLISTGNKSEMSVGYCTLYGDMNGGLAVLGDVLKTLVYEVSDEVNRRYGWIPERTITRAPSAELRPNQTDQDSLPPYDVLDAILAAYVEERLSVEEIVAQGWDSQLVQWIVRRVDLNEYKRRQAPPILRVTGKAFGMGRRNPIVQRYIEKM